MYQDPFASKDLGSNCSVMEEVKASFTHEMRDWLQAGVCQYTCGQRKTLRSWSLLTLCGTGAKLRSSGLCTSLNVRPSMESSSHPAWLIKVKKNVIREYSLEHWTNMELHKRWVTDCPVSPELSVWPVLLCGHEQSHRQGYAIWGTCLYTPNSLTSQANSDVNICVGDSKLPETWEHVYTTFLSATKVLGLQTKKP